MSNESFTSVSAGDPVRTLLMTMVKPSEPAARDLQAVAERLQGRHQLDGKPTLWDRLHVTITPIAMLSEPEMLAAAIDEAMAQLRLTPFRVMLDRVVSWRGGKRRPLVATSDEGAIGLVRLHKQISTAFDGAGVKHERNFTPHVTLLRSSNVVEETLIEPVAWTVSDVQLVLSIGDARRHIPLKRWSLEG